MINKFGLAVVMHSKTAATGRGLPTNLDQSAVRDNVDRKAGAWNKRPAIRSSSVSRLPHIESCLKIRGLRTEDADVEPAATKDDSPADRWSVQRESSSLPKWVSGEDFGLKVRQFTPTNCSRTEKDSRTFHHQQGGSAHATREQETSEESSTERPRVEHEPRDPSRGIHEWRPHFSVSGEDFEDRWRKLEPQSSRCVCDHVDSGEEDEMCVNQDHVIRVYVGLKSTASPSPPSSSSASEGEGFEWKKKENFNHCDFEWKKL